MTELLSGTLIANRYRLTTRLDAGGAAQVWAATDEELGRPIAIKLLVVPFGADPTFAENFRTEAQLEAGLRHPNIAEVYDWGHVDDVVYVVMELLPGMSARATLDAHGPLHWTRVLLAGRGAAAALAYAHGAGIAHANVSARTVMLAPEGHATLLGFGMSCRGTCEYPGAPDSDTYALGLVLYEMLTGLSAVGPRPAEMGENVPWPQHPSKLNHEIPHELDRIVMKAIAPDPADRYPTAAALQIDLDAMAKPKSKAWLWILLAVLAVLIAAAGTWFAMNQQKVVVPDVSGKTSAEASQTLAAVNLKAVEGGGQTSSTVPTGSVISQTPEPGTQVRKGSEVALTVSTGVPLLTIPPVVGLDVTTASQKLTDSGFVVGKITKQNTTELPVDAVMSQDPPAGREYPKGTLVNLTVSAGQQTATVPDVRGATQADATTKLTNAGLKVDVGQAYSTLPAGTVVSQGPAPGTVVPAGSTVTISVSKGASPVKVPNVVGATTADAKNSLTNAGLVPISKTASSTTVPVGHVIDQDPNSGTEVASGSQVTIISSLGP
jgi:eukaryotic-like serine/threonine-protein kinase